MPLIKEVQDALKLVADLPEMEQKHAAMWLRRVAQVYEEHTTMTEEQRAALEKLRNEDRQKMINGLFGPGGKMAKALTAVANRRRKKK